MLQAKYNGMLFNCTQHSLQEQISQTEHYIDTNVGKCMMKENFIDFIKIELQANHGLTDKIINKLTKYSLDN